MKNKGRKSAALLLSVCLSLSLLLGACGPKKENTAADMHLVKAEGTVEVEDGSGREVSLRENLGLFDGYALETQAASYGWINMDDTKLAKMDAVSRVDIRREGKLLELDVRSGNLFFNVTEPLGDDEEMNIRTSNMVAGIRGTCGWVEVPDENSMRVCLLRGKVECTVLDEEGNALTTETITAGESAEMVLEDGEAAITVEELDEAETPQFVTDALDHPEDWEMGGGDGQDNTDAQNGVAARDGGARADGANAEAQRAEARKRILARFPDVPESYVDVLSELEEEGEVRYVRDAHFLGADSQELFVVHRPPAGRDPDRLYISVYRDGPEGVPERIGGSSMLIQPGDRTEKYSLMECDGRMYLEHVDISDRSEYHYYHGIINEQNGQLRLELLEEIKRMYGEIPRGMEYSWHPLNGDFGDDVPLQEQAVSARKYTEIMDKYREVEVFGYTPLGGELIIAPDPAEWEEELAAFSESAQHFRLEGSTLYISGKSIGGEDIVLERGPDRGEKFFRAAGENQEEIVIRPDEVTGIVFEDGFIQVGDSSVSVMGFNPLFENWGNLNSVTFPDSLEYIGREAFIYCPGLTSVTLPAGMKRVEESAFEECYGLGTFRAPASLQESSDDWEEWFGGYEVPAMEWY